MRPSVEYSKGFEIGWDAAVKALAETINFESSDAYKNVLLNSIKYILNHAQLTLAGTQDLTNYAAKIKSSLTVEIEVGDWVRFKERPNEPFRVTKIIEQVPSSIKWAYGVAEDGFTYAGVDIEELEKVIS